MRIDHVCQCRGYEACRRSDFFGDSVKGWKVYFEYTPSIYERVHSRDVNGQRSSFVWVPESIDVSHILACGIYFTFVYDDNDEIIGFEQFEFQPTMPRKNPYYYS